MLAVVANGQDKRTGTAVVVCPGGGYAGLAMDHEGRQVAEFFNGLGVASAAGYDAVAGGVVRPCVAPRPCLPTDRLLADLRWGRLVRELMLEVIAAANALGLRISESVVDKQIERTRTMGAYQASTLIDFERGQPLELESMFLEPLLQARKAGVAAPRLAALCEVLTALDPGQRASHAKSGQFNIPG